MIPAKSPTIERSSQFSSTSNTEASVAHATWRYSADPDTRDLRIDFLRGLAVLFVVVNHIELNSAFYLLSHERIGVVSGAELFVVLSGVVLGLVHRRRAIIGGWMVSATHIWARARMLYLVSLVVMIAAYLLSALPMLDDDVLTTWTDEANGRIYALYGSTPLLADYPVPPPAVLDLLMLNVGPYQFNVMGLYVVLLLFAPFALFLLLAGRWRLLLGISGALFVAGSLLNWRFLPSSFVNQFPLLSWQFLFVIGLIVGFYQTAIRPWFRRPAGRALAVLSWAMFFAFLFFTWNNPAKLSDPWALRLDLIPADTFLHVYDNWFRRDFLGVLRVLNVAVVLAAFYSLLTRFWTPIHRMAGWFFVPLGGATLYVFILHIGLALIVASLPFVGQASLLAGTATHAAVLAALWGMVQTRFLFRWIPR